MITGLSEHDHCLKNKNIYFAPHLYLTRQTMGTMSVPSSKGVDNRPQPSTSFSNVEKNPSICSVSQFFVAVAIGLVNGMLFVAFIMPFAAAWLAWKQPYLVLPAAVAYYFLRRVGKVGVYYVLRTECILLSDRLLYRLSMA